MMNLTAKALQEAASGASASDEAKTAEANQASKSPEDLLSEFEKMLG